MESNKEEEIIDGMIILPKVTRFEVIDHTGRAYVIRDAQEIALSYQDNAKTLKVFVKYKSENNDS